MLRALVREHQPTEASSRRGLLSVSSFACAVKPHQLHLLAVISPSPSTCDSDTPQVDFCGMTKPGIYLWLLLQLWGQTLLLGASASLSPSREMNALITRPEKGFLSLPSPALVPGGTVWWPHTSRELSPTTLQKFTG